MNSTTPRNYATRWRERDAVVPTLPPGGTPTTGRLGWIEGRTIAHEHRWGEGYPERNAEIEA